ncbi:MAG: DUF2442 domain-containing protein [Clostridium sp.]|nr:DUF2442 domain-containing protein [Clostridium sp.]
MRSVVKVQPLADYKLILEFDNGEKRIGDISPLLVRPIFSFLKDPIYFNTVYIEYGAVTWKDPNGNEVDICSNKLYMDSLPA